MKKIILFSLIIFCFSCSKNNETAQWRGDNRDGKYLETGLMKSWPKGGPALEWAIDDSESGYGAEQSKGGIGNGYGSPVVTSNRVYINGEIDGIGYLFAIDLKGNILWKSPYGKEWTESYEGSRSAPTVIGGLIYVCSGLGEIVCFDAEKGNKIWSKNMISDFHGKNTPFGYSESLLIDDSTLFASPGGADTNVIALDRFNGGLKWVSKAKGTISAYCSPLMIKLAKRKLLVTFSQNEFLGLDAQDGKLLWSQKQDTNCTIHGNTPIFENGFIYYSAGCGNGTSKIELSEDGSSIKEIWRSSGLINIMGGFVKLDNNIFGASENKWVSIDASSGKLVDSLNFTKGITISADGMLYCYNEKGEVALVNPFDKMKIISSFKITKGTKEHFSHPVIKNGLLYIRHGKSLMAYKIK